MRTFSSLKPRTHVCDSWRGGQIWVLSDPATIRLRAEHHMDRDKTVALSLIPANARKAGEQVVCRVTGTGADDYTIVEVCESVPAPGMAPISNAASVAAGVFTPGVVTPAQGADWGVWWRS
jgi:hypothetical protein